MLKPKTSPLKGAKAWVLIFAWLIISVAVGALAGGLTHLLTMNLSNQNLASLLVGLVSYGAVLLSLSLAVKKFWKQKDVLGVLGLRGKVQWQSVVWAAIGYGIYFVISWALIYFLAKIFHGFDPNALKHYDRSQVSTTFDIIAGFLQVAILTPFVEEVVFRGYLFGELVRYKMPTPLIIIITGLLFGALHYPPLVVAVDIALIGVLLAFLRHKTGNIWTGLALHIIINSVYFYTIFMAK